MTRGRPAPGPPRLALAVGSRLKPSVFKTDSNRSKNVGILHYLVKLYAYRDGITDENGISKQVNTYGVYTVVNTQAEWKSVNILYTGNSFYLVEPADPADTARLRAGDTVILTSSDMYDGKVVR